ncbi:MAG: energy-coupling factor transporter ATPase [Eubacteriales bacterium]|nr:energy-coupling factor transporter ATPase [Eubacteriales bacterium]MDD4390524.1 energy-coupling factor transporter ATPase [Eubacteriales bacterium]
MGIIVKNLTHIYNEGLPYSHTALDDISFEIEPGEFIGIIGHTGSGKSTLLQHLNGLLKPNEGHIIVGDCDITAQGAVMKDIRRKVGFVFQYPEYQLFEETVKKDVSYGPLNLGMNEEEASLSAREAIELVGLDYDEIAQRSPFELSGGQKRRIAIAGVIAMEPEVLILDEPTAGLDPKSHNDILEIISTLHKSKGNITILVSHNMQDIADYCDKVIVMDKGKIAMYGTPGGVFSEREALEGMGLALPPVNELMRKLYECGVHVDKDILDIDEAEAAIYEILKGKKKI